MNLVRYADRPDLIEGRSLASQVFPEFLSHHEFGKHWRRLYSDFPDFQLALVDDEDLVAEVHAIPIPWDGEVDNLPSGWDTAFELGLTTDQEPTALSYLVISVHPERQGEGLGLKMVETARDAARAAGLRAAVAPVRPTLKDRYPLIPIERYMEWRRADGEHFDPWLRLHERAGGEIVRAAPESLVIEAPVADWEEWTAMALPEDGDYVVPGMLAPLEVRGGVGRHAEPNIWVCHRL